jgi:hypothetical protein
MTDASVREGMSLESLVAKVADEFMARQKRGERPAIEEYASRYPNAADVLRKVLAALELLNLSQSAAAEPGALPSEALPGLLGDFRIVREIGRGGIGIVYEADQVSLGRRVALKVLPFAGALDSKQLQRFKNEAQAAAHLHHTNIVPVHYVGCDRGVHYYAMQLIDGQTLAEVIRELRRLTQPNIPATAETVTEASALAGELASGRWAAAKQVPTDEPLTSPYVPAQPPLTTHHSPTSTTHHDAARRGPHHRAFDQKPSVLSLGGEPRNSGSRGAGARA